MNIIRELLENNGNCDFLNDGPCKPDMPLSGDFDGDEVLTDLSKKLVACCDD